MSQRSLAAEKALAAERAGTEQVGVRRELVDQEVEAGEWLALALMGRAQAP